MRLERVGGLQVRVAGGPDGHGGGEGPVIILLHGFGAPGDDLAGLWDYLELPRTVRGVFPEAPLALPAAYGRGRAWWMIDIERLQRDMAMGRPRDLSGESPAGLAKSRARIVALLADMHDRFHVEPETLVLGGFSQGAMLSCDVALRTERPLAGLVLLSGTLLAKGEWQPLVARRRGLPVFMSHGTADPLLPYSMAERLRDLLKDGGLPVEWVPFGGGHEITPVVLRELGKFLRKILQE
jgi:phospholipase/carboxylesterase